MQTPGSRRRFSRDPVLAALLRLGLFVSAGGCFLVACAPQPKPPPELPQQAPPPAPTATQPPSVWRVIPVPPAPPRPGEGHLVEGGTLVVDDSAGRWLFPEGEGTPRHAELVDVEPFEIRGLWEGLGFTSVTRDGRILAARGGTEPPAEVARLPEKSVLRSARFFEGVVTVRTAAGLARAADGRSFSPVKSLAGRDAVEAIFDARGHGVGLFAPETVAFTRDGGASWQTIPTPGLSARSLGVVEGKIVVAPGGIRDPFKRAVDRETGALSRVASTERAPRRGSLRKLPRTFWGEGEIPEASAEAGGTPLPARLSLSSDLYPYEQIARDGDRVLSWAREGFAAANKQALPRLGVLGEGMQTFAPRGVEGCEVRHAALCGDVVALSCADEIRVFRGSTQVAVFASAEPVSVAFATPTELVSFPRRVAPNGEAKLVRYRVDERPDQGESRTLAFAPGEAKLRGGCRAPALWATGRSEAMRLDQGAPGPTVPIPTGRGVVGIREDGQLVAASDKLLFFLPSADTVHLSHDPGDRVSFAEDGRHGLMVATASLLQQTSDGGRTWTAIAAPATPQPQRVLCGGTRCQLGSGAIRVGFVTDPAFVPRTEEPNAGRDEWATWPPQTVFPTALVCRSDASLFAGANATSEGLAPRLGSLLFAAVSSDESADANARSALFGDVSGKLVTSPLPKVPASAAKGRDRGTMGAHTRAVDAYVGAAPGVVTRHHEGRETVADSAYRWDPSGPVVRHAGRGHYQSPLAVPMILGEDRAAVVAGRGGLLVWDRDRVIAYPFPGGGGGYNRAGTLLVEPDDEVRLAVELDETSIRLVSFRGDERARERAVLVRRHAVRETAVGLVPGAAPALVLTEITEDGGSELRIRPIEADLSLGPAIAVPGTQAADQHLMRLPSCGADPKGTLVRTFTREPVAASITPGDRRLKGYVSRLLRVTPSAACVERTLLAEQPQYLRGPVVLAGNEGIGKSTATPAGLRCEPLVTTPLPAPFVARTAQPNTPP